MDETTFGQLPAIRIASNDGAEAIVTLYGAHLISWKGADGAQRMFRSAKSALDGTKAIRGGVPVIFPQFAERGSGMRHGFARVATWRLEQSGDGWAVFGLNEADLHHLTLGWHRLHSWPDTNAGLTRLKKKYIISPLSNGNVALLTNMAKFAGMPWDLIMSAELFEHYKPDPET